MLSYSRIVPRFSILLESNCLPPEHLGAFRIFCSNNPPYCTTYGNARLVVLDFTVLDLDATSPELFKCEEESRYPVKNWATLGGCHSSLHAYVCWLVALRFLKENLPEDVVQENKVALRVWN